MDKPTVDYDKLSTALTEGTAIPMTTDALIDVYRDSVAIEAREPSRMNKAYTDECRDELSNAVEALAAEIDKLKEEYDALKAENTDLDKLNTELLDETQRLMGEIRHD